MMVSREIYDNYRPAMRSAFAGISVPDPGNPPLTGVVCSPAMQTFLMSPLPFVGGEMGWFMLTCLAVGWIPGMQFFCSNVFFNILQISFEIIKTTFGAIVGLTVLLPYAGHLADFSGNVIPNYYTPLQQFAMPSIVQYSVLSLVVFLVPVIIAVTLLRNFALLFGGEPQTTGFPSWCDVT